MLTLRVVAKATRSRATQIKSLIGSNQMHSSNNKKAYSNEQAFLLNWSAREDSNLRPTGPKPVALPSCATRR